MKKKIIKAKILNNKMITPDYFVMDLEASYLAKSSPGQFVNVKVQDLVTDPLLRIPLGIHRVKGKGKKEKGVALLYKVAGKGTEILSRRKKGEILDIIGPLGNGFDILPVKKKNSTAIIVAGGHGIAPLCFLAETLRANKTEVVFFIGTCGKKHVLLVKDLKKIGAEVHVATEDGSFGCKGYVTKPLNDYLERTTHDARRTTIYACGPRPMIKALKEVSDKFNIPAQVSIDEYMACGIGACKGCAVDTEEGIKMVCKDGPVFDIRTLKL